MVQPYGTPDSTGFESSAEGVGEPAPGTGLEPEAVVDPRRAAAIKQLEKKRGWQAGMVAYVVVNAFLVVIWLTTGRGYFWPAWPLGAWGLGMVLSFWDIYVRRPITEEDIEAELRR
jgi:2TM domain